MTEQPEMFERKGQIARSYMPMKMVAIMACFVAFIVYMHEDLYVRFMAHPSLNALIIGTMIVSISAAFNNAFQINKAASMLRMLERYEDAPGGENAQKMIARLRKNNSVLNTFYLEGAVAALKEPGHIRFGDNQARIMKGKVGQRTSRMRHKVQYMAGVLVMLGLIGTFWGLLETITSVGEAMAAIVESFSKSAEGGGDGTGMVDFLRAISKPLQGMGIAFSASLFGLSGSLITGLLNSFCGKGMDKFMEDFSIWVDARIPPPEKKKEQLTPIAQIEEHNRQVLQALELALSGFARQSHQMMAMFSELINELTQFGTQQAQLTRQLAAEKRDTQRLATTFEQGIHALSSNISGIRETLAVLPTSQQQMRSELQTLNHTLLASQQAVLNHQQLASEQIAESTRQHAQLYNSLNTLFDANKTWTLVNGQLVEALENMHDDALEHKDKIIEMTMTMQNILQTQIDPAQPLQNFLHNESDEQG